MSWASHAVHTLTVAAVVAAAVSAAVAAAVGIVVVQPSAAPPDLCTLSLSETTNNSNLLTDSSVSLLETKLNKHLGYNWTWRCLRDTSTQALYRRHVHRPCTDIMYIGLVHTSCTQALYRRHVQRPCTYIMYRGLVHTSCTQALYIRHVHRPCRGIVYIGLVYRPCT